MAVKIHCVDFHSRNKTSFDQKILHFPVVLKEETLINAEITRFGKKVSIPLRRWRIGLAQPRY